MNLRIDDQLQGLIVDAVSDIVSVDEAIAALTAALLDLPVDTWPVLGGMGNASWVQLSGHSAGLADDDPVTWRLDVWNASAQVANDVL